MGETKQLVKTIFDSMMVSNQERIHSQIFYWLLKLDDSNFDKGSKHDFLKSMFNIDIEIKSINVITEYKGIDIVILINNSDLIAIENKLKSSQHSEQLKRYSEILIKENDAKRIHKFFLSMVKENNLGNWKYLNYSQLRDSLNKIELKGNNNIFLNEYLQTLSNLIEIFKDFLKNPQNYESVYKDSNLSKHKKNESKYLKKHNKYAEYQKYISDFNLETILQKAYLYKTHNELKNEYDYIITESHGHALIEYHVCNDFEYKDNIYIIGIQFQKYTIKINMYIKDLNKRKVSGLLNPEIIECFNNLNYGNINYPRTQNYISRSEVFGFEIIYNLEKLKCEFELAQQKVNELVTCLNK